MKAVDTNVIVRLIARDDARQLEVARAVAAHEPILILPTVLMEVEWVLRSRYKVSRAEIASRLILVCGQDNVTVVSADAVAAALARYAEAGYFADHLHVALASEAGATAFVTFDRNLSAPSGNALAMQVLSIAGWSDMDISYRRFGPYRPMNTHAVSITVRGKGFMNFDQYLKDRIDLTGRTLAEAIPDRLLAPDRRVYAGGLLCMVGAAIAVVWASVTQSDAGFFARTTNFHTFVFGAGLWLLTITQIAHVVLARTAIRSHDAVREKTLARLLRTDGALAHKVLQRRP